MSHGLYQHKVLSNAYDRNYLMDQGKRHGIPWDEHSDEGINWMRFSGALVNHVNQGRNFHMEDTDPRILRQLLDHYTQLRELHKRTMIPHVKAALSKLHQEGGDPNKNPVDYLPQVYSHLEANGGHHWAGKVHTLNTLNAHIRSMTSKLKDLGHMS